MTSTKEPLKYSLASVKKKVAPKLKNVLAQPFPRYWPETNLADCTELKQLISNSLAENPKDLHSTGFNLGTASCLRLLRRKEISCLLISTEIKPKHIATQIINSVISKKDDISVLCVPQLKKITEEMFNVPSLVLAIIRGKQAIIENWVKETSTAFPIPNKLLAYYETIDPPNEKCVIPDKSEKSRKKCDPEKEVNFNELYLTRSSSDYRAFVPENTKNLKLIDKFEWSDYISFTNKTEPVRKMEVDNCDTSLVGSKFSLTPVANKQKKLKTRKINTGVGGSSLSQINIGTSNKHKFEKEKTNKRNEGFNYISLRVNKVQGNPDKKRKKKK